MSAGADPPDNDDSAAGAGGGYCCGCYRALSGGADGP